MGTVMGVYEDGRRVSISVKEWDQAVKTAKAKGMKLVADKSTSPEDGHTFEQSTPAQQKATIKGQKEQAKRNAKRKAAAEG